MPTLHRQPRKAWGYVEPKLPITDALGLHMVLIPGGSFTMGSPEDEEGYESVDGPQHPVAVPSFLMGRHPVTQAQWRAVAAWKPVNQDLDPDPAEFKGDDHPVEQVSWYDAVEFCQRLKRHTGRPYRLPSEAEWEYACRAGTTTPFYFGETVTPELANYYGNGTYGNGPTGEYREKTTPVNQFKIANAFGLSDMHGNVWEWCEDDWHDSYEGAPTDGAARIEENREESSRVIRGGSWESDPADCHAAFRFSTLPGLRNYLIGFRVVCSAPRSLQ